MFSDSRCGVSLRADRLLAQFIAGLQWCQPHPPQRNTASTCSLALRVCLVVHPTCRPWLLSHVRLVSHRRHEVSGSAIGHHSAQL